MKQEDYDLIMKWADENTGAGGDMPYGEFIEFLETLLES